jgi:hypothetical protein
LNISKAARTLIIPLILILGYHGICYFTGWSAPNWQTSSQVWVILNPWPAAFLLIGSLIVYIWLRIAHMVALYKLIEAANVFSFTPDPQTPDAKIICVANAVSPTRELPIFDQHTGSTGPLPLPETSSPQPAVAP